MKLTLTRKNILAALAAVTPAARGTTLPILGHVAIKATASAAAFTCTNLDLTLRCEAEAEVLTPGETTVRASALLALVKSFTGDDTDVRLEVVEQELIVTVGASKYKLGLLPFGDFPPCTNPALTGPDGITLSQSRLRQMLALTSFSASTDEARYVLNGNLLLVGKDLATVATDGRRLAYCHELLGVAVEPKRECILPVGAVTELLRLLNATESGPDQVSVQFTENAAHFHLGRVSLTTKLIEGNYPNYQQVMPDTSHLKPVTLAREEFLQLLQRASIIQPESVRLEFNRQSLTLRALNTKDLIGSAYENMEATGGAKPLKITFNPKYLIEALKALSDDEVLFYATDSVSPGVFKTGPKSVNAGWNYVVMPMRTEDAPAAADSAAAPPPPLRNPPPSRKRRRKPPCLPRTKRSK